MRLLLLLNFALGLYLTGLIWTVQVVHYPGFALVPPVAWSAFHRAHTARITWVVMGPMLLELALGGWLAWRGPALGISAWFGWGLYGLVLLTWAHTGLVAVPLHNRLGAGFDAGLVQQLIQANWVRTIAWTLRASGLGWLVWERLT